MNRSDTAVPMAAYRGLSSDEQVAEGLSLLSAIVGELARLNDNLEGGDVNLRTHHPLCVAPPRGEYTVTQMEAMSAYLFKSIETGALVLPAKEGGQG